MNGRSKRALKRLWWLPGAPGGRRRSVKLGARNSKATGRVLEASQKELPHGCHRSSGQARDHSRMKQISGGWNPGGADNMAHLLSADANDELKRYVRGRAMDRDTMDGVVDQKPMQRISSKQRFSEEDVEKWLRVSMPALKGPHADRLWVKHVLREISRATAQWSAA